MMKTPVSFWRNIFFPYCAGLLALSASGASFWLYGRTHALLLIVPVSAVLGGLVFFHCFVWMLRLSHHKARAEHMDILNSVASAPEATGTAPNVGSYALNGVVVPLTSDEMGQMDTWMEAMPPSVAEKINVACRVAHIIE